jgi:hypothetical protein
MKLEQLRQELVLLGHVLVVIVVALEVGQKVVPDCYCFLHLVLLQAKKFN